MKYEVVKHQNCLVSLSESGDRAWTVCNTENGRSGAKPMTRVIANFMAIVLNKGEYRAGSDVAKLATELEALPEPVEPSPSVNSTGKNGADAAIKALDSIRAITLDASLSGEQKVAEIVAVLEIATTTLVTGLEEVDAPTAEAGQS